MRELTSEESKEVSGGATGGFLEQLSARMSEIVAQESKKVAGGAAAGARLTPKQLEQAVKLHGRMRSDARSATTAAGDSLAGVARRR